MVPLGRFKPDLQGSPRSNATHLLSILQQLDIDSDPLYLDSCNVSFAIRGFLENVT